MSYDYGKFRHRVELQSPVEVRDSNGDVLLNYETQKTVWASIEPLSTREIIQSGANQSKITVRIVIWHRAGISSNWRVKHGDKIYPLEGDPLQDKDSGLEFLFLMCSYGIHSSD